LANKIECDCATIDLSRLPLVVQTVKDVNPTIKQTQEYLDALELVLKNYDGPLYVISDMYAMNYARIKSVVYLGKGIYKLENLYPRRIKLHTFVRPKWLIRAVIPVFNVVAHLEEKQKCTNSIEEAIDWISIQSGLPFYE